MKIIGFFNMSDTSIFRIILITYIIRRLHARLRLRKSIFITEKKENFSQNGANDGDEENPGREGEKEGSRCHLQQIRLQPEWCSVRRSGNVKFTEENFQEKYSSKTSWMSWRCRTSRCRRRRWRSWPSLLTVRVR